MDYPDFFKDRTNTEEDFPESDNVIIKNPFKNPVILNIKPCSSLKKLKSSSPKWYPATKRNINNEIDGNKTQQIMTNSERLI